jgi:hypothetical protein
LRYNLEMLVADVDGLIDVVLHEVAYRQPAEVGYLRRVYLDLLRRLKIENCGVGEEAVCGLTKGCEVGAYNPDQL